MFNKLVVFFPRPIVSKCGLNGLGWVTTGQFNYNWTENKTRATDTNLAHPTQVGHATTTTNTRTLEISFLLCCGSGQHLVYTY